MMLAKRKEGTGKLAQRNKFEKALTDKWINATSLTVPISIFGLKLVAQAYHAARYTAKYESAAFLETIKMI